MSDPSHNQTTPEPNWNAIWITLQELGAALAPFDHRFPRGLKQLASALPGAQQMVERKCLETENINV